MITGYLCYYVNLNIYLEDYVLLFFFNHSSADHSNGRKHSITSLLHTTQGFAAIQSSRYGNRKTDSIL